MRGTNHSRDEHAFSIGDNGTSIYAPRVTIRRDPMADMRIKGNGPLRSKVGINELDSLLGEGIPFGSSVLISGTAGTGKTMLSLEFIYRGAKLGEKGIFVSFEETTERLHANARSMGWDLEGEINRGNIEILSIPQTDILIERDMLMIHEHLVRMGAKRLVIDSISLFVHKIDNPQIAREKTFQLATLVQKVRAVGFFTTDIPFGSDGISRFGVEETVVDGVILLSTVEIDFERERYIEVYKLRNSAHLTGRHKMSIGPSGINIQMRKGKAPPPRK